MDDGRKPNVRHGGDRVAEVLQAQRVPVMFTLVGGHISPILVAAKRRGIRIVDTRDEATAVFAADAVARLTGRPGVAAVTAGPGLTNAITPLKNAQLAQSPVVLIGGGAPTALQGRGALQDIDQRSLIAPHVKHLAQVKRVRDLGPATAEALRIAAEGVPGPVFLECAVDLLYDEAMIRQWYADAAGKGTAVGDRLLRWYLNRHAARMFAGAAGADAAEADAGRAAARAGSRASRALPMRWRAPSVRCSSSAARRCSSRSAPTRSRRRSRNSASRSTSPAWRAVCSGRTIRCRCATRAAMRCANPIACCWPACRATSGSTTAATCAAPPR